MIETGRSKQAARRTPSLWGGLHEDRRSAIRDQWSTYCDHVKELPHGLVGPTPRHKIQILLRQDGICQQIYTGPGFGTTIDRERGSQMRAGLNASRSSA